MKSRIIFLILLTAVAVIACRKDKENDELYFDQLQLKKKL
jgi:hypothetical protein